MTLLRLLILLFAVGALGLGWWFRRRGQGVGTLGVGVVLLGLSCASVGLYNANHIERERFENPYEMFHYYLATHYFREVGYNNLYIAACAAMWEEGEYPPTQVRDLRSGRLVSSLEIKAAAPKAKRRFSDKRWRQWRADVVWFVSRMGRETMWAALQDKGYNATPVWTMVGGALSRQVRATPSGMLALSLIDVALWTAALAVVLRVFGRRAVFVLLITAGTLYSTRYMTLKAAFMRVDWLCFLLGAMAAERRGRSGLAGALVALAGLSRVFPFVFAFGPAVILLRGLVVFGTVDRRALRFLLALGGVVVLLVGASVMATSPAYWGAFFGKIGHHEDDITGMRIGFLYLLAGAWDGRAWGGGSIASFYAEHAWIQPAVRGVALLGAAGLALRLRAPWERLVIGFFLLFFLTSLTYYYYVVLLVPVLWLASRLRDGRAAALLCLTLLGSAVTHGVCDWLARGYASSFSQTVAVLVLIIGASWLMVRAPQPEGRRA